MVSQNSYTRMLPWITFFTIVSLKNKIFKNYYWVEDITS